MTEWQPVSTPPDRSGRFLVEMLEHGFAGERHFSTATYWRHDDYWQIDNQELEDLTPLNWLELSLTPIR